MRIRQFKSEKGMTLVELLAALALFGLVVALSSGVIVQLMGSEQKTSASISLQQEANVAMSELRSQFYNNDTNKICLSPDTPLQVKDSLIINGEEEEKQLDSNNCITDVDHDKPLKISLTFASPENGQNLELKTTWVGREIYSLIIIPREKPGLPSCSNVPENVKTDKIKNLTKSHNNSVIITDEVDIKHVSYAIKGHLTTEEEFEAKHSTLSVIGNSIFKDEVEMKHSVLDVKCSVIFEDETEIEHSTINIVGDGIFNGTEVDDDEDSVVEIKQSTINITNDTWFAGELELDHSTLTVHGDAQINHKTEIKNADIQINGKLSFKNEVEIKNSKISLTEEPIFNNKVEIKNSKITINGEPYYPN
ncbi:prepilin-type N-terminal cleavage/methylation domain-containing protein [Virgibacillus halodenitrificans]|nr:prepilin-type N-terminal cleavage/methylation domain-containing protein [Virgibacillus halodenitrificans]